jgi:hypothetical protein
MDGNTCRDLSRRSQYRLDKAAFPVDANKSYRLQLQMEEAENITSNFSTRTVPCSFLFAKLTYILHILPFRNMARDESIDVSTDKYLLPRSAEEATRLDSQHDVLVHATRPLFHPALGNLSQFRSILDCGTGTTVWLRDLLAGGVTASLGRTGKARLPDDCVLEGCDSSSVQVPTPLPNGIADFLIQDVLQAFPQNKQERYDLVHQRFLSGGIPARLWPQALGSLKGAIKPGGYLTLHEAGFPLMAAGPPQTSSCTGSSFIEQKALRSCRDQRPVRFN